MWTSVMRAISQLLWDAGPWWHSAVACCWANTSGHTAPDMQLQGPLTPS